MSLRNCPLGGFWKCHHNTSTPHRFDMVSVGIHMSYGIIAKLFDSIKLSKVSMSRSMHTTITNSYMVCLHKL